MTHDELLAKIEASDDNLNFYALRAVVELHKPYELVSQDGCRKYSLCEVCARPDSTYGSYPCETIEAIEKEFK